MNRRAIRSPASRRGPKATPSTLPRPRVPRRLVAAAVLGVVCLAAGAITASGAAPSRSWLAAGDSYSSGEGLPHATGPCAQALPGSGSEDWADVARDKLANTIPGLARPRLVACSGASSSDFFTSQWTPTLGRFDLVTFTFGGNDIGFSQILEQCIGLPGARLPSDPGHNCPQDALIRARIADDLVTPYRAFLTKVADNAVTAGGNIVVLGYPELVEIPTLWPAGTSSCSLIGVADANEIRGLGGDLNATLGYDVQVVNAQHPNGVHLTFIDINSGGSAGISQSDQNLYEPASGPRHNLCATQPWLNGLSTIDYGSGSFHPKQAGQDAMGALAAEVISGLAP
jgi:lysophospholipase L1-like esterase